MNSICSICHTNLYCASGCIFRCSGKLTTIKKVDNDIIHILRS